MKHHKRFKALNAISPGRDIGYISGRAKRGKAAELRSAEKMQALLRDYTYHLISLGNIFRDIAGTHGEFEGSQWRSYQGCLGTELQQVMKQTNSTDPYDVDAILKLERAIEAIAAKLTKEESCHE